MLILVQELTLALEKIINIVRAEFVETVTTSGEKSGS